MSTSSKSSANSSRMHTRLGFAWKSGLGSKIAQVLRLLFRLKSISRSHSQIFCGMFNAGACCKMRILSEVERPTRGPFADILLRYSGFREAFLFILGSVGSLYNCHLSLSPGSERRPQVSLTSPWTELVTPDVCPRSKRQTYPAQAPGRSSTRRNPLSSCPLL